MAHARGNHLTPQQIADRREISVDEVMATCRKEGVPVFRGKIDRHLFALVVERSPPATPDLARV